MNLNNLENIRYNEIKEFSDKIKKRIYIFSKKTGYGHNRKIK